MDETRARRLIRIATIAAAVHVGLGLLVRLLVKQKASLPPELWFPLLVATLLLIYGMYRGSRACAVGNLLLYIARASWALSVDPSLVRGIPFAIMWCIFYFQGVRGTLALHSEDQTANKQEAETTSPYT